MSMATPGGSLGSATAGTPSAKYVGAWWSATVACAHFTGAKQKRLPPILIFPRGRLSAIHEDGGAGQEGQAFGWLSGRAARFRNCVTAHTTTPIRPAAKTTVTICRSTPRWSTGPGTPSRILAEETTKFLLLITRRVSISVLATLP